MKQKKRNPAAGRANRVPGKISLAAISSESSTAPLALQAAHLTARFRVSPTLAPLVAALAFGEGRG